MFVVLKVIHIYALMLGAVASFGNGIILARLIRRNAPPPEMLPDLMALFGRLGRWGVSLLWLSGIGMAWMRYGTLALGWVFYVKLAAATAALMLVMTLGVIAARARNAGRPPDLKRLKVLSTATSLSVLVAIVAAVTVFN